MLTGGKGWAIFPEVGVATVPGSSFFRPGAPEGKKYTRFAFCKTMSTLEKAVEMIQRYRQSWARTFEQTNGEPRVTSPLTPPTGISGTGTLNSTGISGRGTLNPSLQQPRGNLNSLQRPAGVNAANGFDAASR